MSSMISVVVRFLVVIGASVILSGMAGSNKVTKIKFRIFSKQTIKRAIRAINEEVLCTTKLTKLTF